MQFSAESMWEGNGFLYYQDQSFHSIQQSQQQQYQQQQFIYYQQLQEQQYQNYPLEQFLYQHQKYLSQQQQEQYQYPAHQDIEDSMVTSLEKKIQENEQSEDFSNEFENFNVFGRLDESINLLEQENCMVSQIKNPEKFSEEYQQYPSQTCDISSQSTCYSQSSPQSSYKTIETLQNPRYIELFSGQGVHLSFFDCPQEQTEIDEILLFNGESVVIYMHSPEPQTIKLNARVIIMKPGKQLVIRRALADYNDIETITQFPLSSFTPGVLHFQAIDQEEHFYEI